MSHRGSKILAIAWRNLGRNRRRTVITSTALAFGMTLCVATYGVMDGMNAEILRSLTRLDLGHLQVHHPDFPRKRTLKLTVPDADRVLGAMRRLEGIEGFGRRLYGYGLASHHAKSAGVQLIGVDPTREPDVTELHTQLIHGRYLPPSPTPWPDGRALTEEEQALDAKLTQEAERAVLDEIQRVSADATPPPPRSAPPRSAAADNARLTRTLARKLAPPPPHPPAVLIGSVLAGILEARVGSRVFVITQTVDGLAAETHFRVAGIFKTGTDLYDRSRVYMHLGDLQRFLHLQGRVHEITARARSSARAGELAAQLATSLGRPQRLLVRSWDVIRPDILGMIQLNQASTGLMVFVIFIVAALGVVNTMLMAVFERTRELGMLKAIGMSGPKILLLVLAETALLVLVASAVGTLLGLGFDLYMLKYGVDLSAISGGISVGGMGVSPVVRAAITAQGIVVPILTLSGTCFLGALYPAIRAARMRPAQGMREV